MKTLTAENERLKDYGPVARCPICRHDTPHVGCVTATLQGLGDRIKHLEAENERLKGSGEREVKTAEILECHPARIVVYAAAMKARVVYHDSFLHDQPVPDGCGFHEYLELDGYDGPEFPPRP